VRLFGFADQEAVEHLRLRLALLDRLDCAPSGGDCDRRDDGIRAHSESADGFGINMVFIQQLKYCLPDEASALGVQSGDATVDIVVACAAGGELELTKGEAFYRQ